MIYSKEDKIRRTFICIWTSFKILQPIQFPQFFQKRENTNCLTIAHQFIAQLDDKIKNSVFGNVGSICSFRVGADDAEYLKNQFEPVFTVNDLMNIDNRNAYLKMLVDGRPVRPFNIETLPPAQGSPEIIETLKQFSYLTYGRDRE